MKPIPTQNEIVAAFARALVGVGVNATTASQMNAIIQAATLVRNELCRENVGASPGMGLAAWCRSDDTGLSAVYMAWVLNGGTLPVEPTTPLRADERPYPHDPSDLGRCVRMLRAAPNLRENLDRMREASPVWAALINRWAEFEILYDRVVESRQFRDFDDLHWRMKIAALEAAP